MITPDKSWKIFVFASNILILISFAKVEIRMNVKWNVIILVWPLNRKLWLIDGVATGFAISLREMIWLLTIQAKVVLELCHQ